MLRLESLSLYIYSFLKMKKDIQQGLKGPKGPKGVISQSLGEIDGLKVTHSFNAPEEPQRGPSGP